MDWIYNIRPLHAVGVMGVIGTLLLLAGWRGRRIGTEPRCRRCRYDLSGLTGTVCPECGWSFARQRPRHGVRRRIWPLIWLGLPLFLASPAIAGWLVWSQDWRKHAPMQLLALAADWGDVASIDVLLARQKSGAISAQQLRSLIQRGLATQHDAPIDAPRLGAWLRFLAALDRLNLLNDAEWQTAMSQSYRDVRVRVRPVVRSGGHLPIELTLVSVWPDRFLDFEGFLDQPEQTKTSNSTFKRGLPRSTRQRAHGAVQRELSVRATWPVATDCPVSGVVQIFDSNAFVTGLWSPSKRRNLTFTTEADALLDYLQTSTRPLNADNHPIARHLVREQTLSSTICVVPSDSNDDVEYLTGPAIRAQVESCLEFSMDHYEVGTSAGGSTSKFEPRLVLRKPAPCFLGYELELMQDETRVGWGAVWARAGDVSLVWAELDARVAGRLKPGNVKVSLRPAPSFIRATVETQTCGESLELGPVWLGATENPNQNR